jgi:hypothetical protein
MGKPTKGKQRSGVSPYQRHSKREYLYSEEHRQWAKAVREGKAAMADFWAAKWRLKMQAQLARRQEQPERLAA